MRMNALSLALVATLPCAALAGDYADRAILGFSPDGGAFAFEEYGVEDGSGFAYSNIYVIDTASDSWVAGTPVRVRIEKDVDLLAEARAEARQKAAPVLRGLDIGTDGLHVASNPVTEISADPRHVRFKERIPPEAGEEWALSLGERNLPAAGCPTDLGYDFKGFRLDLETPQGSFVLNDDQSVPSSRKCPIGYGISDAFVFHREDGRTVLVTLVNLFSVGFEGPNRRFLAVTKTLGP